MSKAVAFKVGDKVSIEPSNLTGTIKFQGPTKFAKGRWIGVHLDKPEGKNDGSVNGVKYFSCPAGHGIFVKPEAVSKPKPEGALLSPRGAASPSSGPAKGLNRSMSISSLDFDPNSLILGTAHEDLFDAAKDYENFHFLQILVEEDGVPVTGTDQFGNTALHVVSAQGGGQKCLSNLRYLLDKGLEPYLHQKNIFGQTAVMCAAVNKRWEVVEFLVTIGADVISKGQGDTLPSVWDSCQNIPAAMTALHTGLDKQRELRAQGKLNVAPLRHKTSTLLQALFKTAHAGDLRYVKMLVEDRDFNVNTTDSEGNTVLHWIASDPKRLNVMKYLVSKGGRINIRNKVGDTACLVAARGRAWPVMQYLVSIGSSISIKDEKNQKSVFKYAQANLISRKALADGLAEKKTMNLAGVDQDETAAEVKEDDYERENFAEERAAEAAAAAAAAADEKGENPAEAAAAAIASMPDSAAAATARSVLSLDNADTISEADSAAPALPGDSPQVNFDLTKNGVAPAPEDDVSSTNGDGAEDAAAEREMPINENWATASTVSDVDNFRSEQEVLDDLRHSGNPNPQNSDTHVSAGTFSGICVGRKKDKNKGKVCKVAVNDNGMLVQYKKGAWYKRKDCVDEYKWSDQMSLRKMDETTLVVVLDPSQGISIKISPCQPDVLEEFIWKHIWISVFETSVSEAQALFLQYENFCNQTLDSIRDRVSLRTALQQEYRQLLVQKGGVDEERKRNLIARQENNNKEVGELVSRFVDIRHQGETLLETFEKMYEALERRANVEEQRKKEFSNKEMFHKAADVKNDQEQIRAQMDQVAGDKQRVLELYETMKQAELQYGHVGNDYSY